MGAAVCTRDRALAISTGMVARYAIYIAQKLMAIDADLFSSQSTLRTLDILLWSHL